MNCDDPFPLPVDPFRKLRHADASAHLLEQLVVASVQGFPFGDQPQVVLSFHPIRGENRFVVRQIRSVNDEQLVLVELPLVGSS